MAPPRLSKGHSDPISYTCTCPARTQGGTVLLFYRYWAAPPALPPTYQDQTSNLPALASFHRPLTTSNHLSGKIRLAPEGFNITIGGTAAEIAVYIAACTSHWSFAALPLSTPSLREQFFKPSPGCACVFAPASEASIRIVAEITPMGVTGYVPRDWNGITALSPEAFHDLCTRKGGKRPLLVDVRNGYESRIGFFVTGEGAEAVRLGLRRFAQWPRVVDERLGVAVKNLEDWRGQEGGGGKGNGREEKRPLVTYCTGGIRCEKATRWMAERMEEEEGGGGRKICTLQGGIAAYLAWMDGEIREGRKEAGESLFRGRNYVFDARGSVGLVEGVEEEPVAKCHTCGVAEDRLGKCRSTGCHLVLVVCQECDEGDPRCCEDCKEMDYTEIQPEGPRRMCMCEREREAELWGREPGKIPRIQGWRKAKKRKGLGVGDHRDVPVKAVD